jgi:4-amino-4-deoxy-L-arabinose transferase-like glycosyltransferase
LKEQSGNSGSSLQWILITLFLLWLAVSVAGYYWVQNALLQPVMAQIAGLDWLFPGLSLAAIGRTLLHLLVALWLAFIALGVGRFLLQRLPQRELNMLEELLFGLGLGFGALGILVLIVGVAGLLFNWLLYSLAALLTVLFGRATIQFLRGLPRPNPGRLVMIFLGLSLFLALTRALLPPTDWDGLFYHLTGPKLYLEAGRIYPGLDIPHLNFPALFEMLFMMAMGMAGEGAAVLLHFIFHLMTAGMVYLIARDLLGVKNSWLAVLFFYAMPMVLTLAGWAYNDLGLAFYETAALYCLLKWAKVWLLVEGDTDAIEGQKARLISGNRLFDGWLILSSLFAGLAMGLKYTSFVAPLALVLLMLWWGRQHLRQVTRPVMALSLIAFMVALPWFAKNLVFTGNPVYPFLLGGPNWDEFRADAYAEAGTGIAYNPATCTAANQVFLTGQHTTGCEVDIGYLALNLLGLPYVLTLGIRDANLIDGISGPLFLIFLPWLVAYGLFRVGGKKPAVFNALLFFGLVQYLFWTVGVMSSAALWQSRLLLPAFVVLCPLLAWIYEDLPRFDHPRFSLHRQVGLVFGLVLVIGLLIQFANWLPQQPWTYLIGSESKSDNLGRRLGAHYGAMEMVNERLNENDVALFLWEPRSYYCEEVECRPDSILDRFGHLQYLYGDSAAIVDSWRADGVTHVLLFRSGLELILESNSPTDEPLAEPAVLTEIVTEHLELVDTVGDDIYELYRIKDGN